jgi:hypothetical protein
VGFAIVVDGLALKRSGICCSGGGISFVRLAVDGLALNKLWDLTLPPTSLVDSKKNESYGTCRNQNLLLSFIIQVFG